MFGRLFEIRLSDLFEFHASHLSSCSDPLAGLTRLRPEVARRGMPGVPRTRARLSRPHPLQTCPSGPRPTGRAGSKGQRPTTETRLGHACHAALTNCRTAERLCQNS